MRVLPYFQHVQLKKPDPPPKPAVKPAALPQAGPAAVREVSANQLDVFIPSSPVTGVVYSISPTQAAGGTEPAVLKSGNYSFYRLDGLVESKAAIGLGKRIDTQG